MPRSVGAAKTATFDTDDKRSQYARLVVFNFGVKEKIIEKDKDVNSVSNGDMQKAFKALTGGTLLQGPEGLELLSSLTRKGATDANVAERGLTKPYAAEVRPLLMRGLLASEFGRRGLKEKVVEPAVEKQEKTEKSQKAQKTTGARNRRQREGKDAALAAKEGTEVKAQPGATQKKPASSIGKQAPGTETQVEAPAA